MKKRNQFKVEKVEDVEIRKYTFFHFAYVENAMNVALSLAQGGYFVNIVKDGTGIRVDIYKRK